jgi:hypothetical protein
LRRDDSGTVSRTVAFWLHEQERRREMLHATVLCVIAAASANRILAANSSVERGFM